MRKLIETETALSDEYADGLGGVLFGSYVSGPEIGIGFYRRLPNPKAPEDDLKCEFYCLAEPDEIRKIIAQLQQVLVDAERGSEER